MADGMKSCPKCSGEMTQGFTIDSTYGGRVVTHWVAGTPIRSVWTGLKVEQGECIPVGTFRCSRCGFLESYAGPEFAAQ